MYYSKISIVIFSDIIQEARIEQVVVDFDAQVVLPLVLIRIYFYFKIFRNKIKIV